MTNSSRRILISEGLIKRGKQMFRYETHPDQKVWNLMLDEDVAGFINVPVRIEAMVNDDNHLTPIKLERLEVLG